ncbi:hypothetical protein [Sphingomonas baiyangensis]|uniref:Uncharacterized protein n=1 Tax=Sphingomonas baiyangensis TaxID=2572576 RepID=A0A4V5PTX1_9SPHN|nr:hypothetical protein [Sphingomonas baiyangensis]TKD51748.1 hypothetical protein FBR43_14040 [Sphingomonas baiyangensis]
MDLVVRIERHLRRSGMKRTAFGRSVANDPRLVDDLRNGREPRARMRGRIEAYLARVERG